MTDVVTSGTRARVRVPASSANLGPGFDSLGLALGLFDEIDVTAIASGLEVEVTGEGAGDVPLDDTHLVVRALRRGLDAAGVRASGLRVSCRNEIPHSRGLGSSAAAAVGGLVAANELATVAGTGNRMRVSRILQLASEFEGHPDNAAAAIHGGATISWSDRCGPGRCFSSAPLTVHPDIVAHVFVPLSRSSTSEARGLLPRYVPHEAAAFNAGRSALMVAALTARPDLLMEATEDLLHQQYRASAMPQAADWMWHLRHGGVPAAISGAGPAVLALTGGPMPDASAVRRDAQERGLAMRSVRIADGARPV